ncbi:hypothetical protein [Cohnella nanjingensis]|uniref:Uncharacterized protein n=1 Tax=Cohnella nanjingensis TaxID=1387779 RepID=A0A7X0RLA4_9BACL|nr:hypothetical protein [Cohnella nanjingensis]MBB6669545.1 hypothetical protein [Cohnella nanjingensis]
MVYTPNDAICAALVLRIRRAAGITDKTIKTTHSSELSQELTIAGRVTIKKGPIAVDVRIHELNNDRDDRKNDRNLHKMSERRLQRIYGMRFER